MKNMQAVELVKQIVEHSLTQELQAVTTWAAGREQATDSHRSDSQRTRAGARQDVREVE